MVTRQAAKKKYGNNFTRKKLHKNCRLKEVWVWPDPVTKLVEGLIKGKSLNVCCGASTIGDVKADLEPINKDIIKADMRELPFKENSFDTVIQDPPWKINFFHRARPFFECVRVCKLGGRIIYNCTWRPVSKCVELEKAYIRTDGNFTNISIIWVFKKTKNIADILK